MKNRIKRNGPVIRSRAEMEALLAEVRGLKIEEQKVTAQRNLAQQSVDERYGITLRSLAEDIQKKVDVLQCWAEANPQEFEKRKSIETAHGTLGFRTGTPKLVLLSRKFTWLTVLENVKQYLPNFIRQKPEIDKEAIIAQRDEEPIQWAINKCGMKVDQDESFFVEPKLDEVETREVA